MTAALAFVAVASGCAALGQLLPLRPTASRLSASDRIPTRLVRPLLRVAAIGAGRLRPPAGLDARIAAAGAPGGLGAREVVALKALGALAGAPAGALLAGAAPGRLGLLAAAGCPLAGFLAPDLWLARTASARRAGLRRELPPLLDLLAVMVDAGMTPAHALGEVGRRSRGELAREWRATSDQVALGASLGSALASLRARAPVPETAALTAAIERSARHGAPLAATLDAIAREARLARQRRIQEEAARAGPKMQLVVALLLVPSVLLVVAAALSAALVDGAGLAFE